MTKQSKAEPGAMRPGEKLSRMRQRHKLIDACISALHQHGPSRTTIDKVVAIADMSPGIVNFYFETKAALLIAALDYLAVEFEEEVLLPLGSLRDTPVLALHRLVELYLDPDIASPRKVSVWYAFWGEASSRREYYEICGKRDVAFGELVRDLMARLIEQSGARHLDADAVALGLIGSLEMMWQGIAFQDESDIDRAAARQRCIAYLGSIFPQHFGAGATAGQADAASRTKPAAVAAGQHMQDACALLLAGELSLAGVPAVQVPIHWYGYHVLAQPEGRPPQRIFVEMAEGLHDGSVTRSRDIATADWVGVVVHAEGAQRDRRFYIIPSRAVAGEQVGDPFEAFENNFRLDHG